MTHIIFFFGLLLVVFTTPSVTMAEGIAKQKAQLDIPDAERQCQDGHLGLCMRLGLYYEKLGNLERATQYFTLACDGDDPASCIKLADFAELQQDHKTAMRWLRRACRSEKGDGAACFRIANFAAALDSSKNAATWFKKACDKGYQIACEALKEQPKPK